jgi:ribosomal protein S18 acetylase RimI-like enzyme
MPVTVRPARPSDDTPPLLYASAAGVYGLMFGAPGPALAHLRRIYHEPGTTASWDACLVAELDGRLAGVLAGYPLAEGPARARRFFARGARLAGPARWVMIARLVRAGSELTPPAPAGSWYVDALATDPAAQRRGVARALLAGAEAAGREAGCRALALDTGLSNLPARRLYEAFAMAPGQPVRTGRRGRALGVPDAGFIGYAKAL